MECWRTSTGFLPHLSNPSNVVSFGSRNRVGRKLDKPGLPAGPARGTCSESPRVRAGIRLLAGL